MQIGYMRVSSESDRQTTDLQRDAQLAAGVDSRHLFDDHASGAKDDRPGLVKALAFVQAGDVLVVWKLDRLGRSLSHSLSIVNALKEKKVAFRSLTEGMDTTTRTKVFGSEDGANIDIRVRQHWVRTALHPLHRFLDGANLPEPKAGDQFLGLRERAVHHRAFFAREMHALGVPARLKPFAR
jgi:hypothetical protein